MTRVSSCSRLTPCTLPTDWLSSCLNKCHTCWMNVSIVLFFFYGATARCRALASLIKPLHSSLSCTVLFQFLTPINYFTSFSTTSIHLFLGFPTRLLPPIMLYNIFFGIRSLFILCTCLTHCNLLSLIVTEISVSLYNLYNSLLYLIQDKPLRHIN
jgi:hypothetical protein